MDETIQKLIGEYYAKLPSESQKVVSDMKWMVAVQDIGKKYGLRVDQIGKLGNEILLALLGITHQDEFGEMIHVFGLDDDKTNEMTLELEKAIFWPIREELMEVFVKNTQAETSRQENQKIEDLKKPFENPFVGKIMDVNENKVLQNSGIDIITDEKVDSKNNQEILVRKELEREIANPAPSTPISLNEIKKQVTYNMKPVTQAPEIITVSLKETIPSSFPGLSKSIPIPVKNPGTQVVERVAEKPAPQPSSLTPNAYNLQPSSTNMVSEKLEKTTGDTQKSTDYSMPKITRGGNDPYREEIE